MITPDYIERSNRKTLSLTVMKDGNVVVKAPLKMSDEIINNFVLEKQNWIKEKLAFVKQMLSKYDDIANYKKFLLYGNRYSLLIADVKKIETNDFKIVIPKKYEGNILGALKSWYKQVAKHVLSDRLKYIQEKLKLKSNSMRISDQAKRWGTCNSSGAISFNWRVILMPPAIIDYVIVHELCHLVEMNHSKKFWDLVYRFLPNAPKIKKDLKEFGFLLDLFRKV